MTDRARSQTGYPPADDFSGRRSSTQLILTVKTMAKLLYSATTLLDGYIAGPAATCGRHVRRGDLDGAVAQAMKAAGDEYVNILGANITQQCLGAGLLDKILMFMPRVAR